MASLAKKSVHEIGIATGTKEFASAGGLGSTRDDLSAKSGNYATQQAMKTELPAAGGGAGFIDTLSQEKGFASAGGLGSTRDDFVAKSGNYAVDKALAGSALITSEKEFASAGGLGSTRDDYIAKSGNYEVDKALAKEAMLSEKSFASAGGLGSTRDPLEAESGNQAVDDAAKTLAEMAPDERAAALQIIEAGHQASVSTLADLPPDLLASLPEDTLLRLAYSPEDMATLDLNGEHAAIGAEANLLSVNNADAELTKYLLESGQFSDVIWSGHGNEEGVYVTGEDGSAELLSADDMAAMFCDTGVEEILLNVCDGGAEVDDALNAEGISTFGHDRDIYDLEAIEDARVFAESGSLGSISTEADKYGGEAIHNDMSPAVGPAAAEPTRAEKKAARKAEKQAARAENKATKKADRQAARAEMQATKKADRKASRAAHQTKKKNDKKNKQALRAQGQQAEADAAVKADKGETRGSPQKSPKPLDKFMKYLFGSFGG